MLHPRPLMIIAAVIAILVLTYRTITVTPETQLAIVGPDYANVDGLPDGLVEGALKPGGTYRNDYVTIDCLHEGKRLVTLTITILEVAIP